MARRKSNPLPQEPASSAARHFPPRWLVLSLALLALLGALAAIAGPHLGEVLSCWLNALYVLPVFLTAAMLGLRITDPFTTRNLFDASPWPAGLRLITATALGLGAFALATLLFGTLHFIEPAGNPWPLLALPLAGGIIGFHPTRQFLSHFTRQTLTARAHRGEWLLLLAAVPIAVLLIAATFPPGSIWFTEGHGYDVMEYHLQLPREYALNNSAAPLAHNVYSYLPGNVEMLYLLLMQLTKSVLGSDRDVGYLWATFPAQFTHTLLMLLTAAAIALFPLGRRAATSSTTQDQQPSPTWLGATGRVMAALLFLGTPWTIVTGSLAYNEAGMLLFGTLALAFTLDPGTAQNRKPRALFVGLLLGLAIGCKMTAGVFFALPVAALYIVRITTDAAHWRSLALAAGIASLLYSPWALRAAIYSRGNPIFPLATTLLPRDGWTDQETQRFNRGHSAPENKRETLARLQTLAEKSLLDNQWSFQPAHVLTRLMASGESPATAPSQIEPEPWWKHIGLLWLAFPLALIAALLPQRQRTDVGMLLLILGVQLLCWLYTTQLEARFLLPIAIPLALIIGAGIQGSASAREPLIPAILKILAGILIALHALGTALLLPAETTLLGGVLLPQKPTAQTPPPPIGDATRFVGSVSAQFEPPNNQPIAPKKTLIIATGAAWSFIGDVDYATVFDRSPFYQLLSDPKAAMAWLKANHIRYVYIDWNLWKRMKLSYGFDPMVTPDSILALQTQGAVDMHLFQNVTPEALHDMEKSDTDPKMPMTMVLRIPQNP